MPDPVIAIAAFVGLCMYAVVGGIVGTMTVKLFEKVIEVGDVSYLAGKSSTYGDCSWTGFGFAAVLWPAVLVLELATGLLAGPTFLAYRVGRYVASAQLKES